MLHLLNLVRECRFYETRSMYPFLTTAILLWLKALLVLFVEPVSYDGFIIISLALFVNIF